MRSLAIAIVVVAALLATARAETELVPTALSPMVGAPMLLSACLEDDPSVHCDPYIAGVVDSIISNRMVFQFNPICIPPGVSIDILRSITINFLQAHPEFPPNAIAASAVVTAITEAYPCTESD
jgi:Ssp1 endopeptidase immunity protein Rap1a